MELVFSPELYIVEKLKLESINKIFFFEKIDKKLGLFKSGKHHGIVYLVISSIDYCLTHVIIP